MDKSRFACMQNTKQSIKPQKSKNKQKAKPKNTRFKSEDFFSSDNVFKGKAQTKEKGKEIKSQRDETEKKNDDKKKPIKLMLSSKPLKIDTSVVSFPELFAGKQGNQTNTIKGKINYSDVVKKKEIAHESKIDTKMLVLSDKNAMRRWLSRYIMERKEAEYLEKEEECDLIWANWQINYQLDKKQRENDGEIFYPDPVEDEYDYDSESASDDELDERDIYDDN